MSIFTPKTDGDRALIRAHATAFAIAITLLLLFVLSGLERRLWSFSVGSAVWMVLYWSLAQLLMNRATGKKWTTKQWWMFAGVMLFMGFTWWEVQLLMQRMS